MRRDTINYVAVGSFVLIALSGMLVTLYLLTGNGGPVDRYFVEYRDVTGLGTGTPVFFQGYPVGKVEGISPAAGEEGMRYRVAITVPKGWRVPEDSIGRLVATGLLSAVNIDIREGRSTTLLEPGGVMSGREGSNVFAVLNDVALDLNHFANTTVRPLLINLNDRINSLSKRFDASGPDLIDDLGQLLTKLDRTAQLMQGFLDEGNSRNVQAILGNLKTTSENVVRLSERANGISDQADRAARNLADLAQDLHESRRKVDKLVTDVNTSVNRSAPKVDSALTDLRHTLDVVAKHVDTVAYHMEGTSRNMHEFSREIRHNPGLLLGGRPPREDLKRKP